MFATLFEGGVSPLKAKAAVDKPAPAKSFLAVFKLFFSVHVEPFHCSVSAVYPGGDPPKVKAAVVIPTLARFALPVFKSVVSVQLDPSQVSVTPE